jgi:hypothetical protein
MVVHTVWQLPLAVARLVVLLLQLLGVAAAATAAANQHAQSLRRSKVRAVFATPPSAIKCSQGFPKAACCAVAQVPPPPGRKGVTVFYTGHHVPRLTQWTHALGLWVARNTASGCPPFSAKDP